MRGSLLNLLLLLILLGPVWEVQSQRSRKNNKKETKEIDPRTRMRLDMMYVEACTEMIRGDYTAAEQGFLDVLKLDAENHASLFNLGKIAMMQRQYGAAIRYGQSALEKDPANFWYYELLVQSYESNGDYRQAIAIQERLIDQFPDQPKERLRLADLLVKDQQTEAAIRQLEQVESVLGISEETAFRRYELFIEGGEFEEALAISKTLLNIDDRDERFYKMGYEAHIKAGQPEAAAAVLESLLSEDPDNGFALLSLAAYHAEQGKIESATPYLSRAFRNPDLPIAQKVLPLNHLIQSLSESSDENITRVSPLINTLLEVHPDEAEGYTLQGKVLQINGEQEAAYQSFRKSLGIQAANIDLWHDLLHTSDIQEDFERLRDDAEEAREYYPNDTKILFYAGRAYGLTGNSRSAKRALEKVVRLGTSSRELVASAYGELARIALSEKEIEEAEQHINDALELDETASLIEIHGDVLMAAGKKDDALREWNRAIELGGNKSRIEPKMQGQ